MSKLLSQLVSKDIKKPNHFFDKIPLEFVLMMAILWAIAALSIDAILPALLDIQRDFAISKSMAQQSIFIIFITMGIGNFIFGIISDTYGRKPPLIFGLFIYLLGCAICAITNSYWIFLIGRAIQGFGLGAPRSIVLAIVRDKYSGDIMAKIMSIIISIFMLTPMLAPLLGQAILAFTTWPHIFSLLMISGSAIIVWVYWSFEESITNKVKLDIRLLLQSINKLSQVKGLIRFTLVQGVVLAPLMGYIGSAQQIYETIYGVGNLFGVYFGFGAAMIIVATSINAFLVETYGMLRLVIISLKLFLGFSVCFVLLGILYFDSKIPFALFFLMVVVMEFSSGLAMSNISALAIENVKENIGLAGAFITSFSMLISAVIAIFIGYFLSNNLFSYTLGCLLCVSVSYYLTVVYKDKKVSQ